MQSVQCNEPPLGYANILPSDPRHTLSPTQTSEVTCECVGKGVLVSVICSVKLTARIHPDIVNGFESQHGL